MSSMPEKIRRYWPSECAVFRKTDERFGGLSNMAGGYPLVVNGIRILTSEALYQACRFPHQPELQKAIIAERSPMTAKMKSKPHRKDSRQDWDAVRVPIMKWCIRIKLAQNWSKFYQLLESTNEKPIVEYSRKDAYWGAKSTEDGHLEGENVLGRLLMELRSKMREDPDQFLAIRPVPISDFLLFGQQIETVYSSYDSREKTRSSHSQDLFLSNQLPL